MGDALVLVLALSAGAAAGAAVTRIDMSGLQTDLRIWLSWKSMAVLALALPPALLWVRGARTMAWVAAGGGALAIVALVLMAPREVAFDNARAIPGVLLFGSGCVLAILALAREAWAPHWAPPRPLPAWSFAGPVTLALAWGLGGSFLVVVPLWIFAPILVAMPALARWRLRPTAALAAAGLLLAGIVVPLGTCIYPNISDVFDPNTPRSTLEPVKLWEVAGHGPSWVRADLMGSGAVVCPRAANVVGTLWLAALAAVAFARWPEPEALVKTASRIGARSRA